MQHKKGDLAVDGSDKTKVIEFDGTKWNLLVKVDTGEGQETLDHDIQVAALFGASKELYQLLKEFTHRHTRITQLVYVGGLADDKVAADPLLIKARAILEKIKSA